MTTFRTGDWVTISGHKGTNKPLPVGRVVGLFDANVLVDWFGSFANKLHSETELTKLEPSSDIQLGDLVFNGTTKAVGTVCGESKHTPGWFYVHRVEDGKCRSRWTRWDDLFVLERKGNKMIDLTKTYVTMSGAPVQFLTTRADNPEYPLIAIIGRCGAETVTQYSWKGINISDESRDLVPSVDLGTLPHNAEVEVSVDGVEWERRHFAGIGMGMRPLTYPMGQSCWTFTDDATDLEIWNHIRLQEDKK